MVADSSSRVIAVAAVLTLIGCAGQAARQAPEAPSRQRSSPPGPAYDASDELAALEHDLAVSEERLFAELDRQRDEPKKSRAESPRAPTEAPDSAGAGADVADESPPSESQPAEPEPGIGAAVGRPQADAKSADGEAHGSPCEMACHALSSMRRSAERICALTSETHPRCQSARGRVREAEQRLTLAGCGCTTPASEE
jgi:hypothetical protein